MPLISHLLVRRLCDRRRTVARGSLRERKRPNPRNMPDISGCVDIAIMNGPTMLALPFPHPQLLLSFGAGTPMTLRTGLRGVCFADFVLFGVVRIRFISQHRLELIPRCIGHAFGQIRLHQTLALYFPPRDPSAGLTERRCGLVRPI